MDATYYGIPAAIWFYIITFIVIWTLALLFKDKLKIDITGPLLMRRTTRMRDLIDSIAQKSPRFWKISMTIGIPVAVFFMVLIFYLLIQSLDSTITTLLTTPTKTVQSGVGIIVPGVDIPGSPITPPLGYGLAGLVTVIVFHEFAHGILARAEGIKIKSIGLLLLAVLPGAFVEPDEEGVKKASRLTKLRIYAAGSISNISLAAVALAVALLLSTFFIGPSFHSEGLEIQSIMQGSPADGILKEGMLIQNINGQPITGRTSFVDALNRTHPGDTVTIVTDQGTFNIKTGANPDNPSIAYIGVRTQENLIVNEDVSNTYGDTLPWILFGFVELLQWIFILNFGIGTFNLLPLKPLDGGLMLEELLNYRLPEDLSNKITNVVSIFSLMLVVSAIGLSLISAYT